MFKQRFILYPSLASESQKSVWWAQLGSAVDLRVKVRGALASTSWVDLRVKVRSLLGRHNQGDTGTASTSGHGTSRSSSIGRCGGRSCRGGVEEAAETRLNNLAGIRVFIYLMGLEVWKKQCTPEYWSTESRAHGRAEVLPGTQEWAVLIYKVNHNFSPFGHFKSKSYQASEKAIRRSSRRVASSSHSKRVVEHPWEGAGIFGEVR